MSRFIDFGDGKALMVNNADWLLNLNYCRRGLKITNLMLVKPTFLFWHHRISEIYIFHFTNILV